MKPSLLACLLLACLLLAARPARAEPVEDGGRIGLQVGWRYTLNGRFAELAAAAGHPLAHAPAGGPAALAVFAYRPKLALEVSLEAGFARERFRFAESPPMDLWTMPVDVALRYAIVAGAITPYLGGGFGYFLNFVSSGPVGSLESHGTGPFALAGVSIDVSERLALLAEYRIAFARVAIPGLGPVQTGGNWFLLGAQVAFAPEPRRLLP